MPRGDIEVIVDKTKLERLIRTAPRKAELALDTLSFDGERDVKQSFGTSPSSPGSPPGVDTGALRASIHVEKPSRWIRRIVTGTEYAIHLEYGTSKMAARPFMMPMAMRLRKKADKAFNDIVD
jgi:hypothetical protein